MQEQQLRQIKADLEEALAKGPNYWKDRDPQKYRKMLNELKSARKTPGHKERAQQQILQAKRRERGGAGTKTGNGHSGKMSGKHSTKVKQYQSSEKNAGTKLSPDRKDNGKGYQSGNVRNVPQNLNRGRHNVDEKKLSNWKKKLKKADIDSEQFMTLLRSKILEKGNEELADFVRVIDIDRLMETLEKGAVKVRKFNLERYNAEDLVHMMKERLVTPHEVMHSGRLETLFDPQPAHDHIKSVINQAVGATTDDTKLLTRNKKPSV